MKSEITMKKKAIIWAGRILAAMSTGAAAMLSASADGNTNNPNAGLDKITQPIEGLLLQVFNVAIALVTAVGAIFCISLGVKLARAEEPQEREKAKQHLKNAIIGFVLIFVLVVALRIGTPYLTDWMNAAAPAT